jgi:hypothetical protein
MITRLLVRGCASGRQIDEISTEILQRRSKSRRSLALRGTFTPAAAIVLTM